MSKKLCIFGDSITWGAVDPEGGGWVNHLRSWYEENAAHTTVYNLGISGDTSETLNHRIFFESQVRNADQIVVAIGLNDSLYEHELDLTENLLFRFRRSMEGLAETAKLQAKEVAFIGITCPDEKLTAPMIAMPRLFYTRERAKQFDLVVREVAEAAGVQYISVFTLLASDDLIDGLHPNSKGHKKLFDHIHKQLFVKQE